MEDKRSGICSDLTVIIPTLNEVGNIGDLLTRLGDLYPGISIIVADDASTDGTQKVVEDFSRNISGEKGKVFLLERKDATERGITASVLEALEHVGTDYFAVMDADLQHPPEVLGQLIDQLDGDIDMVIAARLPYNENQGIHRIISTRVATMIARLYLRKRGFRIIDPMSGFFLARTSLIKSLVESGRGRFEPEGYKILFDILRLVEPGISLRQVSYQFQLREEGASKIRAAHAFFFLRSLFK